VSIQGWYDEHVLPRVVDLACASKGFHTHRADTVAGARGTVLEIGFGTGHNLVHYGNDVDRLLAVEPSARAIELATARIDAVSFPVEVVGLDGQRLPVGDGEVDCVVSTFTLCTIPDPAAALAEVRRVLRPGGSFHVLEHGLADDHRVQRWQRRAEPVQRRVAGGCHLTRHVPTMLADAGFTWTELHRWTAGRPKSLATLTRVTATTTP
jgi:ubiquinone/menaquinone biosynthesis C-methylase UbiE